MEGFKQLFGGGAWQLLKLRHAPIATDPLLCNIVDTSAALPNNSWHCQLSHVALLPAVLEPSAGRWHAPWHQLATGQVALSAPRHGFFNEGEKAGNSGIAFTEAT